MLNLYLEKRNSRSKKVIGGQQLSLSRDAKAVMLRATRQRRFPDRGNPNGGADGTVAARSDATATRLGRGRTGRPREADAAGVPGVIPPRPPLYGPRPPRPTPL